jgi:hypothetical protein
LMILALAFFLRERLQAWIGRLIMSYIIAIIFSFWIIKYFSEPIMDFTDKYLNPVAFITWIYWLFEIHISYLFVESLLTSLLFVFIFWFLIINYISERRYLWLWFLIIISYVIINDGITPLMVEWITSLIEKFS